MCREFPCKDWRLAISWRFGGIAEAEVQGARIPALQVHVPPMIMLTVGELDGRSELGLGPVYECPKCGYNTTGPFKYKRIAPERPIVVDGSRGIVRPISN